MIIVDRQFRRNTLSLFPKAGISGIAEGFRLHGDGAAPSGDFAELRDGTQGAGDQVLRAVIQRAVVDRQFRRKSPIEHDISGGGHG